MWANRDWVGRWLPATTRPGGELAAYARLCTAVEGNTTFYAVPSAAAVARWAEAAPEAFRFVCKVPAAITHEARLRDADATLGAFLARMAPVADRLGPLSVQLPASFGPQELGVLEAFLVCAPSIATDTVGRGLDWAVEVRHPAFFDGGPAMRALHRLLGELGVDRVVLDSRALFAGPCTTAEERDAFARKPRLPVRPLATGRHPVVRFIGQSDPAANPPFWRPWVDKVAAWLAEGRHPTVFVHTPDNRWSPILARRFHDEVRARCPWLDPLPVPLPVTEPVHQPGLW